MHLLQQNELICEQNAPGDDGDMGMLALKISSVRSVKRINQAANIHCNQLFCFTEKVDSGVLSKMHQREIIEYMQNGI